MKTRYRVLIRRYGQLLAACAVLCAGTVRAAEPMAVELEEIVVTGTRLRLESGEVAVPVLVMDRARIEESGAVSVSDLMRLVSQAPYVFSETVQQGGAQFAQLRGLGVDSTLVLINGRRTVPSAGNVALNAFDLNTIPLAAVERVEVLSDAASAVYGADAVGGVVNIVLKRDIPRPAVELSVGSAEGGGEERRASLSGGYAGSRLHASLVLDYFDRDYLLGAQRERWANQDYTRYGSLDWRLPTTNPANISSRTLDNLPGLPSRVAVVPEGSTGVGLTPTDFLPTAGQVSVMSPFAYRSIVSDAERRSASLYADYEMASWLSAFAEALYVDRVTRTQSEPATLFGTRVPATNPFNPFGVEVSTDYLFVGLGPRETVAEADLRRGVLGLRGDLGDWDWELSGLYTRETSSVWTKNAVDLARVTASLASLDPALALNVFQDGPGGSEALLRSLVSESVSELESGGRQVGAFVRGPLASVPAGEIQIVLGGEHRREDLHFDSSVFVDHDRTVDALFAEVRIPLVNSGWQWPLLQEASLTLAGRQDDYSDFGATFNPQYGLQWQPHAHWRVNASYGTSFRAPALFELYGPRREIAGNTVSDPRRNGESVPVTLVSGGNPQLDPVEAESWTAGLAFTPSPNWRLSGTYWHTVLEGRVAIFSEQLVLANEGRFPQRVERQAPSPADVAAGLPGVITRIDISRINFGSVETAGVDASVSGSLETTWGEVGADLSATWVDRYAVVQVPQTPTVERVGVADLEGSIPDWRGVLTLHWSRTGWAASVTTRYVPAYEDRTIFGEDVGRDIGAQALVDVQASLDVSRAWGTDAWASGLKLTVGVLNVFDEVPRFAEVAASGYDPSQGDLRQRFGYVRLGYEF